MKMTHNFNKTTFAAVLVCATLAACSSDDDDNADDMDGDTPTDVVTTDPETTGDFAFSDAAFTDYTRVDRMGMPAVATVLIASKDSYNTSSPTDDAAGTFVPEIITSLTTLHDALDDDLQGLSLTPCTMVGDGSGTCVTTAAPFIVPDTISIDTSAAAGFPNGRLLTDPVIDVTLALALLELTGDPAPHAVTDLVGVLNPAANDLEFNADFPFLADPH